MESAKKIKMLREIPPTERLRKGLPVVKTPPPFELKIIEKNMFRTIMKKMKPKRTHGVDWIDSYSLKVH